MTSTEATASLEARVTVLELQNRRFRRFLVLSGSLILPLFLLAAKKEKTVRANGFILEDASGRPRAEIGFDKRGSPGLNIYSGAGKAEVVLGFDERQKPNLNLNDGNETKRLGMGFDTEGFPGIDVLGSDGTERVSVGLDDHEQGEISVGDGRPRITLTAGDRDRRTDSRIIVADADYKTQIEIHSRDRGEPVVQLNRLDESAILGAENLVFVKGTQELWKSPTRKDSAAPR